MAGSGIGIGEHSHRGKVFDKIIKETEQPCRELAGIAGRLPGAVPAGRRLAPVQHGADEPAAQGPHRRLPGDGRVVGEGGGRGEAVRRTVHDGGERGGDQVRPDPAGGGRSSIPRTRRTCTSPRNNTIYGTQWTTEPPVPAGVPLVADTSSDMFSRPIDVSKYGLIYAGAQKNLGPSGVVLVIMRERPGGGRQQGPADDAAVPHVREGELAVQHAEHVRHLRDGRSVQVDQGRGRAARRWRSTTTAKAKVLYDYLDQSKLFTARALPGSRSLMNVCFYAASDELDSKFVAEATKRGLRRTQGPSIGRRAARQHLQRDARGGRAGAGRVHEGVREDGRLGRGGRCRAALLQRGRPRAGEGADDAAGSG